MTPNPTPDQIEEDAPPGSPVLKWIGLFTLFSFALGFTIAGIENTVEYPQNALNWVAAGGGIVGLIASGWLAIRLVRGTQEQPLSASEKGGNRLLLLSAALGGVLAIAMIVGTSISGGEFDLFSNSPVPPIVSGIVIAAWLALLPWITIAWYKTVDEHERDTYIFGAALALHVYAIVVPAWWIGWRGGLLPEVQHMVIYLGVVLVWCAGWLWRRLR